MGLGFEDLDVSRGSVNELLDDLRKDAVRVVKLINGYIAYLRRRIEEG